MIDRIGGSPLVPLRTAPASTTAPAKAVATVAAAAGSTLAATVRDLAAAPPVDTAKVDRVRSALALGTYAIDPATIADRMIALDLPHRG